MRRLSQAGRNYFVGKTIWILGDQLSIEHTALAGADKRQDVVLLIESRSRGAHLRYHKIKLVLIYSAMRHFAAELRADGWTVDYHTMERTADFDAAWERHVAAHRPDEVLLMEPNSWFEDQLVREVLARRDLKVSFTPTRHFVVPRQDFLDAAKGKKRLLMENHYRATRQRLGILVTPDGEPEGGAWNFDSENRKTVADWKRDGAVRPPAVIGVPPDEVTREVMRDVDLYFPGAFGSSAGFRVAVTRAAALQELERFVAERLVRFGDYQDLMLADAPGMFHSWISGPLNVGLLSPRECVDAAVEAYRSGRAPLAAVEGFVRQIIGWREFVNGVYWLKMPDYAASNTLGATRPLPDFFYSGETDLNCLRHVLQELRDTAYNHHIQRLMVLGNFLLLAGIRPQEALRWFTEMYVDAFDWVMAANVLGMALHADGGFMATKPYCGSGAYLSKMGNYCAGCRYDPKKKSGPGACPFNLLYWDFYDRHAERFARNPRTSMMVKSWEKRPELEKKTIRQEAARFLDGLK